MSDDKPKRRWRFRFSLLALLLAMTAVAIGLALVDWRPKRKGNFIGIQISDTGVGVKSVLEDSPAATAGLKPGDVILALNGAKVSRLEDLFDELSRCYVGQKVYIKILRGGKVVTQRLTIGKFPRNE